MTDSSTRGVFVDREDESIADDGDNSDRTTLDSGDERARMEHRVVERQALLAVGAPGGGRVDVHE